MPDKKAAVLGIISRKSSENKASDNILQLYSDGMCDISSAVCAALAPRLQNDLAELEVIWQRSSEEHPGNGAAAFQRETAKVFFGEGTC